MTIQTTINMHESIKRELDRASAELNISRTCIIRLLLKSFLDDNKKTKIFQSPVKYQAKDDKQNWSKFHITLREDEYELCLDLRKVYKMSFSFIISSAVRKYLKKIFDIINTQTSEKITDNYLFHNYAFSFTMNNSGIKIIKIHWGVTNINDLITDNYQNTI